MGMALECLPICFLFSVSEQDTVLASQDSLQKGDVGSIERQGIVRCLLWGLVAQLLAPQISAYHLPGARYGHTRRR
jgi:hypothetical protein